MVTAVVERRLAEARRRVPFGAARLVREFELPCSVSAAARAHFVGTRRQAGLTRRPRSKKQKKQDLREVKQRYAPLCEWRLDTKFLRDTPHYWPQMVARQLPRYQYALRELRTRALFLSFGDELAATYGELTARRLLRHLKQHGLQLRTVTLQTDNGTEYDGHTRQRRDRGLTHTIAQEFAAAEYPGQAFSWKDTEDAE